MSQVKEVQPTMADLLKRVSNSTDIKVGDQIAGKLIFVAKNEVLMDIENVGLGIIRGRELYNEEYLSRLKVGEIVEAIVLDLDNELGYIELSFRAIGRDKIWSEIKESYETGSVVEARIREANRGGFLIKVQGIDGFLPASLLSPAHAIKQVGVEDKSLLNQMKKYIGQVFNVKIISINPDADTLIVSEKSVSDELAQVKLKKYKVGDVVETTVVGAVDFGLFVRFDSDLEGLIHISEIAWKKVEDPKQHYKVGNKVSAKIVEIDKDNRINLSVKQLLPNPWIEFSRNTKPGDKFSGRVSKIVSYGAIIVNDEDIQGLCHISQISEQQLDSPAKIHEVLKVGERKDFTVLGVDPEEKLYLTLLDFNLAKEIQESLNIKQKERQDDSIGELINSN
ncbi:MAG: S1 RNA-binding domain-containing protein [Patescibacteria group bacterium]